MRALPLILSLLLVTACGTQKKTRLAQAAGLVPPQIDPTITNGCQATLAASAQVLTPLPLLVGQEVLIQIQASLCTDSRFRIQNDPSIAAFSATTQIKRTFASAGTVGLVLVVEAFDPADNRVLGLKSVSVDLVIGAATPPAGGAVDALCQIRRVAGTTVNEINSPMPVVLTSNKPVLDYTINGVRVPLNTPFNLSPVLLNSGLYVAQGSITTATGIALCGLSVEVPTCQHTVTSAQYASGQSSLVLQTSTTLTGAVSALTVNSAPVTLVAGQNPVSFASTLAAPISTFESVARVTSPLGDSTACKGTFEDPLTLEVAANRRIDYVWAVGYTPPASLDRVLTGAGAGNEVTQLWVLFENRYTMEILKSGSRPIKRNKYCDDGEVMVGRSPSASVTTALNEIYCQTLRPEITITSTSDKNLLWTYNSTTSCSSGMVLVGSDYTSASNLRLRCAKLTVRP